MHCIDACSQPWPCFSVVCHMKCLQFIYLCTLMQSNCFKHTFSNVPKNAEGPKLAVTVRGQDQTLTVATVSQMSPADFSSLWRVRTVHPHVDPSVCSYMSLLSGHVLGLQVSLRMCCWQVAWLLLSVPCICAQNETGLCTNSKAALNALHSDASMVIELGGTCTHCHHPGNGH